MANEPTTALGKYVDRGFVFLMSLLVGSLLIFILTNPHDPDSFEKVIEFGVPAWFGLNAVERWAVDRVKVQNGSVPK